MFFNSQNNRNFPKENDLFESFQMKKHEQKKMKSFQKVQSF